MHYGSLIIFTVVLCITPGPNNLMVMASGLNFRHSEVYPQILGTTLGSFILCLSVGFFLQGIFTAYPGLRPFLGICTCIYLVFLAWKFFKVGFKRYGVDAERPITFFQSLFLQVVNPKVWAVATSMLSIYVYHPSGGERVMDVLIATTVFALSVFLTKLIWLYCGVYIKKYLTDSFYQRVFNIATAGFLVLTVVFVIIAY